MPVPCRMPRSIEQAGDSTPLPATWPWSTVPLVGSSSTAQLQSFRSDIRVCMSGHRLVALITSLCNSKPLVLSEWWCHGTVSVSVSVYDGRSARRVTPRVLDRAPIECASSHRRLRSSAPRVRSESPTSLIKQLCRRVATAAPAVKVAQGWPPTTRVRARRRRRCGLRRLEITSRYR